MVSTFKRNLIIGYAISLILLIVSSGASYFSIRGLLNKSERVNHTHKVLEKLNNVFSGTREGESGQRGYLITKNENFLLNYKIGQQDALSAVATIRELTSDNRDQQNDVNNLRNLVEARFTVMQRVLDKFNITGKVDSADFETGRSYMQQLNNLVQTMQNREESLLESRTADLNSLSTVTPLLIIVAAVLSFIITIISFLRINADFEKRVVLAKTLEQRDKEVSQRISIIQDVADKISSGNYNIRVNDESKDVMGSLAASLNKMAASLQNAFGLLSHKEWLQTGIATLNEKMIGEKNLETLCYNALEFITEYTKVGIGAFYLVTDKERLDMVASIALDKSNVTTQIPFGQGVAGQSALSKKEIIFDNLLEEAVTVSYAGGTIKPKAIIAMPVFYEDILKGIIELNATQQFDPSVVEFLKMATFNIGVAIHAARDHQRLQALLEETQAQSEELQTQHSELENINSELEAQSAKLQASEEELKVQQEELQQANIELEERSRLLEERNELILERNRQIQAKSEALEVSTKYKSEFLANMSHELRTPLNSILLLSRLLSENHENNLSNDQVEYARVIQSSGNGLLTLIDEILDLSKIESGKMELEYGDLVLESLVNDIKAMFLPLANEKKIAFHVKWATDLPKIIESDKLRLEQILRNLISNALKFT
ncbi:MAG TPA: CHASE3 domain-containing protein, partial [Chitinophagaceae bacterium]|nr:CHASE3 domain-containing protein [Chitinophagaceae bacterium]